MTSHLPEAQLREAVQLERAGRVPEAIAAYERLLAAHPALPESWFNLAVLRRKAGRFDAALAAYREALDRGVREPEEAHLNRGVIYADHLRQDAAAERELAAALALNPRYVPALLNLANLHEDLGRREAALATYERLLGIDGHHPEALARYASLQGAGDAADPLIERLRAALAGARDDAARASLGFALGKLLDECGAYDEAFEAYAAANRASRASAGVRGPLYDRAAAASETDALIAGFSTPVRTGHSRDPAAAPTDTPRPLFICGMFRSGSTLVEQVLARHPQVCAGGELDLLPAIVREQLAPYPAAIARLSPERRRALAAQYLDGLARRFPGAAIVTDKRPDNFRHIGLIKVLFPEARIVHTTRNPLDNCLSIWFLHLDPRMGYALDLMDTGHHYAEYRRLMAHWRARYDSDILDVDYDQLVRAPRESIGRLLAFCGLAWDEACLSPEQSTTAVKTASVWQVRRPIHRDSSGRAAHYARPLAPLAAWLKAQGIDR
ncbi:MAG: sulfotransferase [Steroidobacteraceae bacterium]